MIRRPQCFRCANMWKDNPEGKIGIFCDAYPDGDGVPNAIVFYDHLHTTPYPGDGDILFKPKEDGYIPTVTSVELLRRILEDDGR